MHTRRLITRRLLVCAVFATTACWYGPPEGYRDFDEYMIASDSSVAGYMRAFHAIRWPHGLVAFPDGGIPKDADSGAEVFFCRGGGHAFRQVARIFVPPALRGKAQYHLAGWTAGHAVLGLGGDSGVVVKMDSRGKIDPPDSPLQGAPVLPGLLGATLVERQAALDSLRQADPILNYTT